MRRRREEEGGGETRRRRRRRRRGKSRTGGRTWGASEQGDGPVGDRRRLAQARPLRTAAPRRPSPEGDTSDGPRLGVVARAAEEEKSFLSTW